MNYAPSSTLIKPDVQDLQSQLDKLNNRIQVLAMQGQYVLADQCRKSAEELEKEIKELIKNSLK